MNFLQKGLAGLESRLDMVLLDEPDRLEQQARREPLVEPPRNGEGRRSVEKGMCLPTYLPTDLALLCWISIIFSPFMADGNRTAS